MGMDNIILFFFFCSSLSRVWLFATPWTVAHQASSSMEFSRHEYWSGLPFPSPYYYPIDLSYSKFFQIHSFQTRCLIFCENRCKIIIQRIQFSVSHRNAALQRKKDPKANTKACFGCGPSPTSEGRLHWKILGWGMVARDAGGTE